MPLVKKTIQVKTFELLRELNDKDKCPPQSRVIVKVIQALGGKSDRATIIAELSKPGVLTTRQTPERIFGFYRPRLLEMGVMKEFDVPTEIEVEEAEKPAKAPKVEGTAAPATEGSSPADASAPAVKSEDKSKGKKAAEPKAA